MYSVALIATLSDRTNHARSAKICLEFIWGRFVLTLPQECHRWQCYPIWVGQEVVITALVAAAASLLLELAGCRYILIRLSLGHKHMQQVLFECTRQPKGQLCAPSVSKCIRISGSAELSWGGFPWVIQMAVEGGGGKLTGFSYPRHELSSVPPLQSFNTHYQKHCEKFMLRCCSPVDEAAIITHFNNILSRTEKLWQISHPFAKIPELIFVCWRKGWNLQSDIWGGATKKPQNKNTSVANQLQTCPFFQKASNQLCSSTVKNYSDHLLKEKY